VRVGDDGVIESGAPSTISGVNVGGACDPEFGGGRLDVLDGCYRIDALGSWVC
jgi:hypothetical protein